MHGHRCRRESQSGGKVRVDEKVRVEEYVRLKKWSLVSAGARSMHGCNKAKSKGWGGKGKG